MKTWNRIIVFILLMVLLFALWRYQMYIIDCKVDEELPKIGYEESKEAEYNTLKNSNHINDKFGGMIDDDSLDNITIDNISQFSMNTYEDVGSEISDDVSNDVLGFMDNDNRGNNVCFREQMA